MTQPKNIKDYLHLYPNVPILICEPGCEPVSHYLEGYDWVLDKAIAERVNYDPSWIKPILRKLEDMTEQEINHIGDNLKAGTWNAPDIRNNPDMAWSIHHLTPEVFRYLLKQCFDLFGLIEAGLAIDKNSLK